MYRFSAFGSWPVLASCGKAACLRRFLVKVRRAADGFYITGVHGPLLQVPPAFKEHRPRVKLAVTRAMDLGSKLYLAIWRMRTLKVERLCASSKAGRSSFLTRKPGAGDPVTYSNTAAGSKLMER